MKMELCLYLYTILLVATKSNSASAVIDLTVDPEGEVCPGTDVTFTCSVPDNGLVWEYNGSSQSFTTVGEEDTVGPFMVNVNESNGTFISSTATATAMGALNGTVITCIIPPNVDSQGGTVSVTGPPMSSPSLTLDESTIMNTSTTTWNFILEWELLEEDFISGYVITVDPPLSFDQCSTCIVDNTTASMVFELGVDDPHNFTILAQNCDGTQNGTQNDTLQIHPQLPDSPRSEPTRLLYQNAKLGSQAGNLQRIELIWAPVEPTESITDTTDGSITEYHIRTAGVIVSIDPATCDAKCSGILDVSQSEEVDVYTVSVSAHNSLPGPGNTTIVGTYNATNDYVTVDLMINGSDCYLIIKQLNGAFNLSLDPGTASSIPPDVEVILLNPSINYTYMFEGTASDGTKVIVHGSFETDCTSDPLISPSDENGVGCSCDDDNVDPWIVFLVILVVLLTVVVVVQGAALIYVVIQKRKQGAVNLTTPRETLEMKENMSYGPVRVQSQTPTQEPVYEEADTLQQPVRTGGNVAYGHIRP